jgi:transposase-like protein
MQRKKYSPEFKQQIVKEALEVGNGSLVARKHDLSQTIVNKWVRESQGRSGDKTYNKSTPLPQEHKQVIAENDKLKKLLGEKDLEIEILRDLLKKTNPHLKIK